MAKTKTSESGKVEEGNGRGGAWLEGEGRLTLNEGEQSGSGSGSGRTTRQGSQARAAAWGRGVVVKVMYPRRVSVVKWFIGVAGEVYCGCRMRRRRLWALCVI